LSPLLQAPRQDRGKVFSFLELHDLAGTSPAMTAPRAGGLRDTAAGADPALLEQLTKALTI
jgi:hypothetical protein